MNLAANHRSHRHRAAFSLVEVALACGIAGFCLLAVFGLLPIGLRTNRASIEQTAANSILSGVAADLRATPPMSTAQPSPSSMQFHLAIPASPGTAATTTMYLDSDGKPALDGSGNPATVPGPGSRYRLTVNFLANGTNARAATLTSLQVSWPAPITPANAEGSATTFVALDRN